MKQFFTYVAATVVGLIIATVISTVLSIVMLVMIAVMSESAATPQIKEHSVLKLDLSGVLSERHKGMTFIQQLQDFEDKSKGLDDIVASIRHAATDDRIEGIYIDCNGMSGGIASLQYIRQNLEEFKKSGKWIAAYGDSYTQGNYYIASLADSLWLNPMGAVEISGLGGRFMFFKGLLDKLGVEMQVLKVGTFKSAVEPYVLTAPSEANIKQTREYITPIWKVLSGEIAASRGVDSETVNLWADSLLMTVDPAALPERKVVTGLLYRHQAEEALKAMCGLDSDDDLRCVAPAEYVRTITPETEGKKIALLYAEGDIVDQGDEGIVGADMAPMILKLAEDDDIDALVLRVNSPGGSAFASEQIWEALQQFKAKDKPFYVSMGDVAASGGYYISCGADKIFCQPTTITGSIGIFGLIPNVKGLMNEKIGITTSLVATNPNSDITVFEPMTPFQKNRMQAMIERGYKTFIDRCAKGRHVTPDSINAIGQGRVWDGQTAQRIGLVDELGNLDQCIEALALDNDWEKYRIEVYPDANLSWWEKALLESTQIKSMIVRSELGDAYPYYKAVKRVKEMNPVQCRAPEFVIE